MIHGADVRELLPGPFASGTALGRRGGLTE